MAVAAYAAVVSLMQVLDQIQQYPSNHRLYKISFLQDRVETLCGKVSFLQDFLEIYSQRLREDLARQIAAVAFEAEHIIDTIVVDQLHKGFADKRGIDGVIEKFDSIKKELMMIKEEVPILEQGHGVSILAPSLAPPSSGNSTVVGFDEHLERIIYELTGCERDLQVLPIAGMGGIGKTTLAKTAFDDSRIRHHFDKRIWFTISQKNNEQKILLGLLEELTNRKTEESGENLAKLGDRLRKKLFQRRYLIVFDDVWSTDVWNNIMSYFPNNKNRSRIMVTTRLLDVAVSFSFRNPYLMDFLHEDKSWNLFCEKAFGKDGRCPPELEEVGRSIAKSCKGLPLAIVVIGGLLSKSKMTREYWEFVAKDVKSFANSVDEEHCLKILSLSYHHLPIYLKPCFLQMRDFPEDSIIRVSTLIRSWVAEGFLKPIKDKTLEEAAQEYLEDLVGRNLILISERTRRGKIKSCIIHDLLRDFCIKESHIEPFYRVPIEQHVGSHKKSNEYCILCGVGKLPTRIDLAPVIDTSQPISLPSCSICYKCKNMYPHLNRLRWVKILDSAEGIMHPTKIRNLFLERYFEIVGNFIPLLWKLQYLCLGEAYLPFEIWKLPQLRHLIAADYCFVVLPEPPLIAQDDRKDSTIILKNLQTLGSIENFRFSENAIERIPNLKRLAIDYYHSDDEVIEWSCYSLHNLGRLHKLESLWIDAENIVTLKNISFPNSLKKLSLQSSNIPWEEMTIIGSLPNLEVLKANYNAFTGPEWNPVEGEFLRLKLLWIGSTDLVRWEAEKSRFPNLEILELRLMTCLEKIPSGIGEIETLRSIHLYFCAESVLNSAKEILEEQRSYGNEDFQLCVNGFLK